VEVLGGPVSPLNPTITVHISAALPVQDHSLAAAPWDVIADEGGWLSQRHGALEWFIPGEVHGSRIDGIRVNNMPPFNPWPVPNIEGEPDHCLGGGMGDDELPPARCRRVHRQRTVSDLRASRKLEYDLPPAAVDGRVRGH
jgi:hypothetical protein